MPLTWAGCIIFEFAKLGVTPLVPDVTQLWTFCFSFTFTCNYLCFLSSIESYYL